MTTIDQSGLQGKIRDRPISRELEGVLLRAGTAAGIDTIFVTSGGQPGSTGRSTGSTRHNGGRAADLHLVAVGKTCKFSDDDADELVKRFVTAAAAFGATGIGAGVRYMGPETLHVGFGTTPDDHSKIVWGAGGRSANAPAWLIAAAMEGWHNPPQWVFTNGAGFTEDLPEHEDHIFDEQLFDDRDVDGVHDVPTSFPIPKRFNIDVIRAAQASQRRWRIPASVVLAQWALESAYGSAMPAGSNNPFGIKAASGQPFVTATTKEVINGRVVTVQAKFRAFASLDEAFIKHGELLGTATAYAAARKFDNDPDRFADALTGIYATDPNYGSLLRSIMRKNNLYAFDVQTAMEAPDFMSEHIPGPLSQGDVAPARVEALQRRLVELGYKLGKIDGKFGSLTAAALLSFQNDQGLPTTGVVDAATEAALDTAQGRPLGEDRITADESDLAAKGSRIIVNAGRSRVLNWITAGLGALGIGNSAVVNAPGVTGISQMPATPDGLIPLLDQLQKLPESASAADLARIASSAQLLKQQLSGLSLSPDLTNALSVLRSIPPETISNNPAIARAVEAAREVAVAQPQAMRTIVDILPTFFKDGTVLHTIMQGAAAVGASVIPGFGGSLAVLGLGLAGRLLANRIAAARVEDHRTAGNLNPLES